MRLALAGRIGVGKTTLAKGLCQESYFVRVSMADPLKETIAKVYGVPREDLDESAFKHARVSWSAKNTALIQEVSSTFSLDSAKVEDYVQGYFPNFFGTPREAMQLIGTNLIRGLDPNAHVNAVSSRLAALHVYSDYRNVVVDDVRFKNELVLFDQSVWLERLGYVAPAFPPHESDLALGWEDCQTAYLLDPRTRYAASEFLNWLDEVT